MQWDAHVLTSEHWEHLITFTSSRVLTNRRIWQITYWNFQLLDFFAAKNVFIVFLKSRHARTRWHSAVTCVSILRSVTFLCLFLRDSGFQMLRGKKRFCACVSSFPAGRGKSSVCFWLQGATNQRLLTRNDRTKTCRSQSGAFSCLVKMTKTQLWKQCPWENSWVELSLFCHHCGLIAEQNSSGALHEMKLNLRSLIKRALCDLGALMISHFDSIVGSCIWMQFHFLRGTAVCEIGYDWKCCWWWILLWILWTSLWFAGT